jgi:mannose-6-phosphate isomerase-like protein (cupin superfamily)
MSIEVRHVVTGRDAHGKSVIVSDEKTSPITVDAIRGSEFYMVWGTDDGIHTLGSQAEEPKVFPFFPGPGGTRFLLIRFPPQSSTAAPAGDPGRLALMIEDKLPGMVSAFEPDHPGMHTTDSIDYGLCVEGEMYLELDDGRTVHLTPGTCVVQRGTRHAWHNRGSKPALMMYVLVGANRDATRG